MQLKNSNYLLVAVVSLMSTHLQILTLSANYLWLEITIVKCEFFKKKYLRVGIWKN